MTTKDKKAMKKAEADYDKYDGPPGKPLDVNKAI